MSRTELDPVSFLTRSATIHPDRTAVVHGKLRRTYGELDVRVSRLASALRARGLRRRDRVAVLSPNTPALLEAHFGCRRPAASWSRSTRG
ncbi:MAG TPA: AMP-binding protein [Solirubrobacteraceae bacterium]|nr:AMP-binding protein [Solirubrobacteraceae bacterium]